MQYQDQESHYKAFITGIKGFELTGEEKSFIAEHSPWGFVLFSRNIDNANQLRKLTDSLRAVTKRADLPIFVDQEGGRVQRLKPPLCPLYPPAAALGEIYKKNQEEGKRAAWLMARLIALDLRKYGFTGDFLPLLDAPVIGSHNIIGDRAYGDAPALVAVLGEQAAAGLRAGGIFAVMKHIPGHGRARADTHKEPARVPADKKALCGSDFTPFKALAEKIPATMTAHVIYEAYDPRNPATFSRAVIDEVIRVQIGFDGLLMSDDLSMQALQGTLAERTKAAFAAGCDMVLHCNGDIEEMRAVAANSPYLAGKARERAEAVTAWRAAPESADEQALRKEFAGLMSGA